MPIFTKKNKQTKKKHLKWSDQHYKTQSYSFIIIEDQKTKVKVKNIHIWETGTSEFSGHFCFHNDLVSQNQKFAFIVTW